MALVVEFGHPCMGAVVLQPGVTGPTHDGEEPGTTLPTMKTAKEFPRPHVGFLHDIFRVLIIARQPAGQVVGGVEMRYDRVFKPCACGWFRHLLVSRGLHGVRPGRVAMTLSHRGRAVVGTGLPTRPPVPSRQPIRGVPSEPAR